MIIDMANAEGWKNQQGTGDLDPCSCGSWKQHWENCYSETGIDQLIENICPQSIWPIECSVFGCSEKPTLGAHVINSYFNNGEQIVPMCVSCNNNRSQEFNLKIDVVCVSADVGVTCDHTINGLLDIASRNR